MFKNENKGIVLKRVWFVRPDKTRAWPLYLREMTRAMPSSSRPCYINPYKPSRLKTIPLFCKYSRPISDFKSFEDRYLHKENLYQMYQPENMFPCLPTIHHDIFYLNWLTIDIVDKTIISNIYQPANNMLEVLRVTTILSLHDISNINKRYIMIYSYNILIFV